MRLLITSCRYCLCDPKACEYRNKLKPAVNAIEAKGTMTHRCPVYWTLIPNGTRVEIELKELEIGERGGDPHEPPEPCAEWISAGWVKGTVVGKCSVGNAFFLIKLDEKATLCVPRRGESWFDAEETEVTYRAKRAKDIRIIPAGN